MQHSTNATFHKRSSTITSGVHLTTYCHEACVCVCMGEYVCVCVWVVYVCVCVCASFVTLWSQSKWKLRPWHVAPVKCCINGCLACGMLRYWLSRSWNVALVRHATAVQAWHHSQTIFLLVNFGLALAFSFMLCCLCKLNCQIVLAIAFSFFLDNIIYQSS